MRLPPDLTRITPTPGWAPVLARLDRAIFAGEAWSEAAWRDELGAATFIAYVPLQAASALPTPVAVGGISIGPDADILTLGVSPEHRGKHLGSLLLDDLLTAARRGGATTAFLEVRVTNAPALALYRSRGFDVVGTRPRYYGGEDGYIMRLELGAEAARVEPAPERRM